MKLDFNTIAMAVTILVSAISLINSLSTSKSAVGKVMVNVETTLTNMINTLKKRILELESRVAELEGQKCTRKDCDKRLPPQ